MFLILKQETAGSENYPETGFQHSGKIKRFLKSIKPLLNRSCFKIKRNKPLNDSGEYQAVLVKFLCSCAGAVLMTVTACAEEKTDPLPSWNDTALKQKILTFVTETTTVGHANYLPKEERIAVFDNDGTLWAEQPHYAQTYFIRDRIKEMASDFPEWEHTEPFKRTIQSEGAYVPHMTSQESGLLSLKIYENRNQEELVAEVRNWFRTARHPDSGKPYSSVVYVPMIELLNYLRQNDYKTWIVSGGGVSFIRAISEEFYAVPPEQVIGSSLKLAFRNETGKLSIIYQPKVDLYNEGKEKAVSIERIIGRRPVIAFGNGDNDLQMLQWTAERKPNLVVLIHHTDAAREWQYDRGSNIGKLDVALDEAVQKSWNIIDMKKDWKKIFSDEIR